MEKLKEECSCSEKDKSDHRGDSAKSVSLIASALSASRTLLERFHSVSPSHINLVAIGSIIAMVVEREKEQAGGT